MRQLSELVRAPAKKFTLVVQSEDSIAFTRNTDDLFVLDIAFYKLRFIGAEVMAEPRLSFSATTTGEDSPTLSQKQRVILPADHRRYTFAFETPNLSYDAGVAADLSILTIRHTAALSVSVAPENEHSFTVSGDSAVSPSATDGQQFGLRGVQTYIDRHRIGHNLLFVGTQLELSVQATTVQFDSLFVLDIEQGETEACFCRNHSILFSKRLPQRTGDVDSVAVSFARFVQTQRSRICQARGVNSVTAAVREFSLDDFENSRLIE